MSRRNIGPFCVPRKWSKSRRPVSWDQAAMLRMASCLIISSTSGASLCVYTYCIICIYIMCICIYIYTMYVYITLIIQHILSQTLTRPSVLFEITIFLWSMVAWDVLSIAETHLVEHRKSIPRNTDGKDKVVTWAAWAVASCCSVCSINFKLLKVTSAMECWLSYSLRTWARVASNSACTKLLPNSLESHIKIKS